MTKSKQLFQLPGNENLIPRAQGWAKSYPCCLTLFQLACKIIWKNYHYKKSFHIVLYLSLDTSTFRKNVNFFALIKPPPVLYVWKYAGAMFSTVTWLDFNCSQEEFIQTYHITFEIIHYFIAGKIKSLASLLREIKKGICLKMKPKI